MERKIKMNTIQGEFANLLTVVINACVSPFSKYVVDNYESISGMSQEELSEEFKNLLELPKTTNPVNMMGLAPNLNATINKEAAKRTRTVKKEVDESVWCTIDEYNAKVKEDCKICAYYSTRLKDERNEKVCGAPATDMSNSDHLEWRCAQHKGKASNIKKVFNTKSNIQGIDKSHVIPGFNIPGGMPPPMPIGLGPINGPIPTPPLPPMPSLIPKKELTPPRMPPSPVKIPSPPKQEEKPKEQVELARLSGLSDNHLIAKNASLKSFVFELDMSNPQAPVINCIGKFGTEVEGSAPANYKDAIIALSDEEQGTIVRFGIGYKFITTPVLNKLPGLPPLPKL